MPTLTRLQTDFLLHLSFVLATQVANDFALSLSFGKEIEPFESPDSLMDVWLAIQNNERTYEASLFYMRLTEVLPMTISVVFANSKAFLDLIDMATEMREGATTPQEEKRVDEEIQVILEKAAGLLREIQKETASF